MPGPRACAGASDCELERLGRGLQEAPFGPGPTRGRSWAGPRLPPPASATPQPRRWTGGSATGPSAPSGQENVPQAHRCYEPKRCGDWLQKTVPTRAYKSQAVVFFFAKKLFRSTSISLKRPSSSCSVGFLFETLLLTSRKGANHFNCISSAREKTVSDRASHGVADRPVLRAEEVSQWRPGTAVPGQASRRLSCPGPRAGISVSGLRAQWPSESTGRAFVSTDAGVSEGARPAFGCPKQSHLPSQSQLVMVQVVAIARTMPPTSSPTVSHCDIGLLLVYGWRGPGPAFRTSCAQW